MNRKVTINRLASGVPGLDDVLGGGIPEYSFNLISGRPGCGKTTLAHQMMFALATSERPALYLTVLGEPPLKMLRYQQLFDFFDSEAIDRSIRFANLSDDAIAGDLDKLLDRIVAAVKAQGPALVFVDSFRAALRATTGGDDRYRLEGFVQKLGTLMTSWQATTFLIGDYTDAEASPVFTVADGIILLRQTIYRNTTVRQVEAMKMRGQLQLPGLHPFRIGAAGIQVFAPSRVAPEVEPDAIAVPAARLRMGDARLDEMLGGGLQRGHSLLIAGPSGSGKSILATAFLAEGARCGETGVIAVFEQHPHSSRNDVVAGLIAKGVVGLVDSRAADLSFDEMVVLLLSEIRRLKASRVVIDSLSGFEIVLASTYREDFRESLLRMVTTLKEVGVTVVMTSELEDRYTDLRFSPYGTAFLTDAIIVQRYIEVDSRLRRVMAVVKVRGSAHSHELREFSISDDGIRVGETLPDHEGLLGGRPTKKRASDARPATGKQVKTPAPSHERNS